MDGLRPMSTPPLTLDEFATAKLAALEDDALRRRLTETHRLDLSNAQRGNTHLISFSCNDYLGLSQHPAVKRAAIEALERYGAGAGASRLVTGNHPLYAELEQRLARLKGTEAACVFGSGYLANLGIPPCLVGKDDLIVADETVHASMHAGIQASRAHTEFYPHNDMGACEALLDRHRTDHRHCLIMTEGVFSMDGDCAPLAALCDLADSHAAWLMTDDAHGLGVLGGGRGSSAAAGVADRVPLQMGTLSKAVGAYGGYLCGSSAVIELMVNRARSLIYATGLPPATIAASIAALTLIEQDQDLTAAPLKRARHFTGALGLPLAESPIVPLIVGKPGRALDASKALAERGFLVTAIRPPTVPQGTSRLRFTFSATHTEEDIDGLVAAVREIGVAP
jgi:8-amino-7-oxononanoate synthase